MIRVSWVIFVHAVLLSTESVAIEMLTTHLDFTPLLIAASSSSIAGALLLSIAALKERDRALLVFKSWKFLIPASVFVAAGLFALFDSVSSVGASKVGLLAGPIETVIILLLARAFLLERLSKAQVTGVMIALGGFFATVLSGISGVTQEDPFRWGDAEAVLSAVLLGVGIIFITKLTKAYSILAVTGSLLLSSGLILVALLWITSVPELSLSEWTLLLLFSLLPLAVSLTYVAGLARIGASLTSIIASFSILLTPIIQLALLGLNVDVILPANVPLAITGGVLGVSGIYLIHKKNRASPRAFP